MAEKTTGELRAVEEASIGDLPGIANLYDDTLIPVEQQGEAHKMTGAQWKAYAKAAAQQDVDRAVQAADDAEKAVASIGSSVEDSQAAATAAQLAKSGAEAAQRQAEQAKSDAEQARDNAAGSAALSQSWAVGETGVRDGENTDNAKYWANMAQAEADRATVPAVQGVYNLVLEDRVSGGRYALIVENGVLKLLGVAETVDATQIRLIETESGTVYEMIVEDGALKLQEVA